MTKENNIYKAMYAIEEIEVELIRQLDALVHAKRVMQRYSNEEEYLIYKEQTYKNSLTCTGNDSKEE